jgi:hypothetical protein
MLKSVVAISLGASLGALLRWGFGNRLNDLFPAIPPGTLVSNLVGGYVVGLAVAFFATYSAPGARVAPVPHHGVLRRAHHLLDLFGRAGRAAAAGPHGVGRRGGGRAPAGLPPDDGGRHGHGRVGARLMRKGVP